MGWRAGAMIDDSDPSAHDEQSAAESGVMADEEGRNRGGRAAAAMSCLPELSSVDPD